MNDKQAMYNCIERRQLAVYESTYPSNNDLLPNHFINSKFELSNFDFKIPHSRWEWQSYYFYKLSQVCDDEKDLLINLTERVCIYFEHFRAFVNIKGVKRLLSGYNNNPRYLIVIQANANGYSLILLKFKTSDILETPIVSANNTKYVTGFVNIDDD